MADNVQMLTSICEVCKNDNAVYSYYKGTDKTGDVLVGEENYIPVCRSCYERLINNKEKNM